MKKKELKDENEAIVDCDACNGIISIGSSLRRGAVVCCEECQAEYLLNSRKPLTLKLLENEEENIYNMISGYDDVDDDFSMGGYGCGDDDYNDGRYD